VRLRKKRWFYPTAGFLFLFIAFIFTSRFAERPPVIESIAPEIGLPGNVMIIKGHFFGDQRNGGGVTIAGTRPVSSSYIEWTDDRINVRIPDEAGSGMVYVTTKAGRSKGILFTNRAHIPVILSQVREPGQPYVEEISPTSGPVGTLIIIRGFNFGLEQGQGKVYFSQSSKGGSGETDTRESFLSQTIAASETDFDYESWTDSEIRVRVPDGASSGGIRISTGKQLSNGIYFEVTEPSGTKLYTTSKGYQVQYSVELSSFRGTNPSSIDLWTPNLVSCMEQRNIDVVSEPSPLWKDYKGVMRYRFENIAGSSPISVQASFWFDRYTVQTRVNVQTIPNEYDSERRLYKSYTAADQFVPSADESIIQAAKTVGRREKNPYQRARNIYTYLIKLLSYDSRGRHDNVAGILSSPKTGDSYAYAVLFTALCRSSGIPARVISGYLVFGNKETLRHYWSEFYVEQVGWIPVDPLLGDAVSFGGFPDIEDPEEYYFGNLDNQHITFSKGMIQIKPLDPSGKTRRRDETPALQTICEESSGIEGYGAVWSLLRVIDWW
jgi:hypothetical protein